MRPSPQAPRAATPAGRQTDDGGRWTRRRHAAGSTGRISEPAAAGARPGWPLRARGRRHPGVDLDLDEHPRIGQLGHDHRRVDRPHVAERFAVGAREAIEGDGVDEEYAGPDDVRKRAADATERRGDVLDRLLGLQVRVPDPGYHAVGHQGGRARHDDEIAGADDTRVADPRLVRPARAVALDAGHQWRKCRRPVKTIATPAASAAATTSPSRLDPPGWTIALTPASIASAGPSANGKNASDARTAPRRSGTCAFSTARRTESTRLICPAPIPTVAPPRASTIAFERTCLQTRQAKTKSAHSCSVGSRLVTTSISSRPSPTRSRSCTSRPPVTWRISFSPSSGMRRSWSSSRRTSCLALRTSSAPSS